MQQRALTSRPRGRPKNDAEFGVARDVILAAALEEFAAAGYEGFSTRKLARDLGVSHGLINIRFGSKEQLWRACVDWGLGLLAERLQEIPPQGPIEDRFRAAIIVLLTAIEAVPALLHLVNHEGAGESDRLSYITQTIIAERYAALEEIIKEGVATGKFRDVPSHLIFVLAAHGGGVLFAMQPLAKRLGLLTQATPKELQVRAEQIADLMLHALLL